VEFNTEFLQFSMPWASIYRLGAQMSVRKNIAGRHPDGDMGRPDGQLCDRIFQKFC
jgi:hypothetical protein